MLLACWPAAAAHPCLPCHQRRVDAQATTSHARALRAWTGEHFTGRTLRDRAGTEYFFSDKTVRVRRGGEEVESPIRWAFGSGDQAITPVLERAGKWIELRLSWYRQGDRLGLTPGHDPSPPFDLTEHLGIEQTERNAQRCFGCHTTGGERGVQCRSCHEAGADEHRLSPVRGNIRRDRSVELCASCHRAPDETFRSESPEIDDPRTIRFAPVGFMASECFRKSRDFTCVTCHDPHGEPRPQPVNATCAQCHPSVHRRVRAARQDCVACHMKSSSPMAGLSFTDHRIRVYR